MNYFPFHYHIINAKVLKHPAPPPQHTHNEGSTPGLPVHVLVAQVEDQRGSAVQEGKHPHAHKELGRGAEVPLEVEHFRLAVVARWHGVGLVGQPGEEREVGQGECYRGKRHLDTRLTGAMHVTNERKDTSTCWASMLRIFTG